MIYEDQPLQFSKHHRIDRGELNKMVMESAVFTHIWANRRYGKWIFDVDMEEQPIHIYRMGLLNKS